MDGVNIESFVKERFNMGLLEFMRLKIEEESLYDYEVADQLSVRPQIISEWRNIFGLKRVNGFSRRFEKKYGEGSTDEFKKLVENPNNTLDDVGRYFGFTREYARQVYYKVQGRKYTEIYKEKRRIWNRKNKALKKIQKTHWSLIKIRTKLESMNYEMNISSGNNWRMTSVNGYSICIRSSTRPFLIGRKRYYKISTNGTSIKECDFVVCILLAGETEIYYIIPSLGLPRYSISLSPDSNPHYSKYARFREAWHLLGPRTQKSP